MFLQIALKKDKSSKLIKNMPLLKGFFVAQQLYIPLNSIEEQLQNLSKSNGQFAAFSEPCKKTSCLTWVISVNKLLEDEQDFFRLREDFSLVCCMAHCSAAVASAAPAEK